MFLAYYARNAASAERTRRRIKREGHNMNGDKLWTEEEEKIVLQLAPDYDAICKLIPDRNRRSIRQKASDLGVAKEKHIFTGAEIGKLRRMYPRATWEEMLKAFPFSTQSRLKCVASYYGFRRARKPYKETGNIPIDELLKKCQHANMTLVELDLECRTKRYFTQENWRYRRPNYNRIVKAIELLEGRLSVEWRE